MGNRLVVGRTGRRVLAGLEPLTDRAFSVAGGGQMMRQELGFAFDEVGEMVLQNGADAGVQFLAPRA